MRRAPGRPGEPSNRWPWLALVLGAVVLVVAVTIVLFNRRASNVNVTLGSTPAAQGPVGSVGPPPTLVPPTMATSAPLASPPPTATPLPSPTPSSVPSPSPPPSPTTPPATLPPTPSPLPVAAPSSAPGAGTPGLAAGTPALGTPALTGTLASGGASTAGTPSTAGGVGAATPAAGVGAGTGATPPAVPGATPPAAGATASSQANPTPAAAASPTPFSGQVANPGGLGNTRADLDAAYGPPLGETPEHLVVYRKGAFEYHVQFVPDLNGRASLLVQLPLVASQAQSLDAAETAARALLPRDAQPPNPQPEGNAQFAVQRFTSHSLAAALPAVVFAPGGGAPGQFLGVYARDPSQSGRVSRIVLGPGNDPEALLNAAQ